ncbi:conserved hypothetical protein [Magnetospirillum molischianum DSM 120]|uniref:Uncharacterized protein n=1 Tax=Magnetospirillum molischianum DSM 120 TaxID=1150626 RepID=H8FXI4_MAGML|nr:conserved hypothetical protein [Magnetospirillum molischianum DSM 120]
MAGSFFSESLTQDPHDLGVREPTLLHPNLLVRKTEKILRPNPLISRGDYPSTCAVETLSHANL